MLIFVSAVKTKCDEVITEDKVNDVLSCAADLINLFVQLNWTGPPANLDEQVKLVFGLDVAVVNKLNKESLQGLSWDGEVCKHNLLSESHT